jgi:hypothetical protein
MKLLISIFSLMLLSSIGFAEIPKGCRSCLDECPHADRMLKSCDTGCMRECSRAQKAEYDEEKNSSASKPNLSNPYANNPCYKCMKECPHNTRDLKSCDTGCKDKCDLESMKQAFLGANFEFKSCINTVREVMATSPRGSFQSPASGGSQQ